MNTTQLVGFLVFLLGAVVAFVLPFAGIFLLVLGLVVVFGSIVIERFNDLKKGDLK